jgi:hypothetical protein
MKTINNYNVKMFKKKLDMELELKTKKSMFKIRRG